MAQSGMKIQYNFDGIGHTLSDNLLAVPHYQRSYAWQEDNVRNLFDDLAAAINSDEDEYFLGTIVVASQSDSDLDQNFQIVDGQQRLATTTILLAAIRDYFVSLGDQDRAGAIEREFLLDKEIEFMEIIPRLRLNDHDNEFFFNKFLTLEPVEPLRESHKLLSQAGEIASEYVGKIANAPGDPKKHLIKWIKYIKTNAKVIVLTVPDEANAFLIFETLNDRGLELTVSDLLKNYLFGIARDRLSEVQNNWNAMISIFESFNREDLVVTYMRHLWSSKQGLIREKALYKSIRSSVNNKIASVNFTNELSQNARLYLAMLNSDHEYWGNYDLRNANIARQHIKALNELQVNQFRPLLLAILNNFEEPEVVRSLALLESWAVRFLITGGGGGTLEQAYSERASRITKGEIKDVNKLIDTMVDIVPNDPAFQNSFSIISVSKTYLARYYLRKLEMFLRNPNEPELIVNENSNEITLEHILPQTPSKAWGNIDEELAKAYYRRIGNLTLMQAKSNSTAGNNGFAEKKKLYQNSQYHLTSMIMGFNVWGIREIEDRQKKLAEIAVKVWPYKV